jgi:hypothetical protein
LGAHWSDGAQLLTPDEFVNLMKGLSTPIRSVALAKPDYVS